MLEREDFGSAWPTQCHVVSRTMRPMLNAPLSHTLCQALADSSCGLRLPLLKGTDAALTHRASSLVQRAPYLGINLSELSRCTTCRCRFKIRVEVQALAKCVSIARAPTGIRGTPRLPFGASLRGSSRLAYIPQWLCTRAMGNLFSMHGIKHTYRAEKEDFAQLIAAALANIISQLVGQSVAGALAIAGGAAGIFRSLKDPHVIVRDSPLYWLVDGASILNYPPEGDPDTRVGENGGAKLDRTQVLFAWSAARMQALWQWVYTNGATFAGALYAVFNALPLVQVTRGTFQLSFKLP